ncbi:hypothetical protein Syun_021106 [Stephania yunnanensis]|uniref:Uncharacterized protein n=1 Tax=Stephania yunnanensis TaxID=152371 RepID=A0AAP0NQE7_9MAGN
MMVVIGIRSLRSLSVLTRSIRSLLVLIALLDLSRLSLAHISRIGSLLVICEIRWFSYISLFHQKFDICPQPTIDNDDIYGFGKLED